MLHSMWSNSVDDILLVSRTNKKNNNHKSKGDFSVSRKSSLSSDSSSNKSEKLTAKARFQFKIKKFWHNRMFIRFIANWIVLVSYALRGRRFESATDTLILSCVHLWRGFTTRIVADYINKDLFFHNTQKFKKGTLVKNKTMDNKGWRLSSADFRSTPVAFRIPTMVLI